MGTFSEESGQNGNRRRPGRTDDISFLVVELQDFAAITESYGDDVGLLGIRMMADILRHNIRHDDMLIHKGNGQFVIMLAGVDTGEADDVILRRLSLLLTRDLILTIGRERIRIHTRVSFFSGDDAESPFEKSDEISVFMSEKGQRL